LAVVVSTVLATSQADHLAVVPPVVLLNAFVEIAIRTIHVIVDTTAIAAFAAIATSRVIVPDSIDAGGVIGHGNPIIAKRRDSLNRILLVYDSDRQAPP
jgi:hypothetical protein